MDFYTLTAIKFALGILTMLLQINILGKRDFSLNTPLNQVQNYVLGGIIGGVIYNSSAASDVYKRQYSARSRAFPRC